MSAFSIDDARGDDLAALHAMNQASTPGVGSVTAAELSRLLGQAEATLVARAADGAPIGFVLALAPGQDYASPNYQWFDRRIDGFLYIDRVAVGPDARGSGAGAALYAALAERAEGRFSRIVCEVNTTPPNPGSMRFHERLGFRTVGAAEHIPGEKAVAYLERRTGPRTARCGCGAVSISVSGEPDFVAVCSCRACQRRTGAPFGVSAYFPEAAIVSVTGETESWERVSQRGRRFTQMFCGTCGTTVYWRAAFLPEKIGIAGGTFADPLFPAPTVAVWDETRASWINWPDAVATYAEQRF